MSEGLEMELHVHKVTADETHPAPWRYWWEFNTAYGPYKDEGLCKDKDECVGVAKRRAGEWFEAQAEARRTKEVILVSLDLPPVDLGLVEVELPS